MSSDRDDLERRLEEWGGQPAPPPDPAFAERLERDLRSQAYFSPAGATPTGPRRVFRPALVMGATLLVAVGVWLGLRDGSEARAVVMSEASGTDITRPGEPEEPGQSGDVLPDGTRISVDDTGTAVIDGVVLGGGTEAVVVDGRIEVLLTDPTATPADEPTPTATRTPTARPTSTPAVVAPGSTPRPAPTAGPTEPPAVRPTAAPTATPPPRPTRTPAPDPTATPRPTATPTATPTPQPTAVEPERLTVSLRAERLTARRALLVWEAPRRDDIAGWEVVAITVDGSRTLALLRDPGIREIRIERPDNLQTRYRVRARSADGTVLGVSNPVRFPTAD